MGRLNDFSSRSEGLPTRLKMSEEREGPEDEEDGQ